MTKKVTLPRDVVEAIESLRRLGHDNRRIIGIGSSGMYGQTSDVIKGYLRADGGNFDRLLSALVNGYEVEQPPEEQLREYYDNLITSTNEMITEGRTVGAMLHSAERVGIEKTLQILGIKIEGVNA
ncbi:hypothetical protein MHI57_24940 [Cytobacillus sp. FSL K6-0129]|uniref:hypothetical protein n=1 Tax=Cytobacillus sp. FSL K6-0129 TaxID=2921421 RepID=UPI0030F883A9